MNRKQQRKLWLNIHLWLGLLLGFWLALIGLTGSILVFYYELEELLHPQYFMVNAQPAGEAAFKPMHTIQQAAAASLPTHAKLTFAFYPRTDEGAYWLFYDVPVAGTDKSNNWQVFVNPYTASVLGNRLVKTHDNWMPQELFAFVFDLHYELLLPWKIGGIIVGIIALLTCISLSIGVYLWWPSSHRWRSALRFKRNASRIRFVYDLHNLSGLYLLPILLVVLISGIYFNLPDQFMWVVQQCSPGTVNRYNVKSTPAPNTPIGLTQAIHISRQHYPEGRLDWLYNATEQDAAYTICANGVKSVSYFADRRCVVIDQYSGKILQVSASGAETSGNTFVAWQWPLHSGQAFGLAGRILVLLSGLMLPILFVTGVMCWLQKRRARCLSGK